MLKAIFFFSNSITLKTEASNIRELLTKLNELNIEHKPYGFRLSSGLTMRFNDELINHFIQNKDFDVKLLIAELHCDNFYRLMNPIDGIDAEVGSLWYSEGNKLFLEDNDYYIEHYITPDFKKIN